MTPFQKKVTDFLKKIPKGKVATYQALANMAGYPGAARAVGTVMAKNEHPVVVPCHRVIKSDGMLGNYTAPGGTKWKRELLEAEGVRFLTNGRVSPEDIL